MPQRIFQKSAIAIIIIGCFGCMVCADCKTGRWAMIHPCRAGRRVANSRRGKGFDNAKFDYRIRFLSQRNGYRVYEIKYPSPVKTAVEQNNTVTADYYLPNDIGGLSQFSGDCPNFHV